MNYGHWVALFEVFTSFMRAGNEKKIVFHAREMRLSMAKMPLSKLDVQTFNIDLHMIEWMTRQHWHLTTKVASALITYTDAHMVSYLCCKTCMISYHSVLLYTYPCWQTTGNRHIVSIYFNHFHCMGICNKLTRHLSMLTYIYRNLDECTLISSMP